MKKLLAISLVFFGILFFIFTIELRNITYDNKILYNKNTSITVFLYDDVTPDEVLNHMYYIQDTYNTYIAKYVHKNFDDIAIYSTDVTLGNKINLKNGVFPAQMNDYISNIQMGEKEQTGELYYFTANSVVSIFPIDNLKTIDGVGGIFYINTADQQITDKIVDYLNENIGFTKIDSVYNTSSSNFISALIDCIQDSIPLTILLIIFGVIFFLIVMRFSISQCKMNAIMNLHGYTFSKISKYYLKQLFEVGLVSIPVTSLYILLHVMIRFDIYYLAAFIIWNIIFQILILFLSLVLLNLLAYWGNRFYKKNNILNGKKPFAAILFFQTCLKYLILVFAMVSFIMLQKEQGIMQQKLSVNDAWEQTQNIHKIQTQFVTDDLLLKRGLEIKSFNFYNDIIKQKNVFLINADNYDKLLDDRYIYDANNPSGGTSVYSPSGKSILVNENYLNRHKVYTPEHADVTEGIVYDPFVMNILVPISLKQYESDIYQNFLDGFVFRKITVPNIYNKEFNRPFETTTVDDLSVNIIYVENNTSYFTYNSEIEIQNKNYITDPIVIADTGNFDYSFYYAMLTSSCFFESSLVNPVNEILSYSKKHKVGDAFHSAKPIYSVRAHEIQKISKNINMLILIEAVLIFGFLFSTYMLNACYYEQHRYSIYIKRLFGHSVIKTNKKLFIANTSITTLLLMLFPISLFIKLFVILLDVILMIIFNIVINRSSFQQVVKGEH